jgi:hypothetical protein
MAVAAAAGTAAVVAGTGTASVAARRSWFSNAPRQLEALQNIVTKHIDDPSLQDIAKTDDFTVTTTERGVSNWEHQHMIAALDVLNAYQNNRRARSAANVVGYRFGMQKSYKHDPRTRLVELLKRWLRSNAVKKDVAEHDVRRFSGLCRDILNHPNLFKARNQQSFMRTIADVYQHFEHQLRDVLERDRTCAELAQRVLTLSRNLVSDAIAYLLVGPTDLKQTDDLPSLEAIALWASLPSEAHPLPSRIDRKMQNAMRDVWATQCGTLLANLLRTRWCLRLFEGAGAQDEAAATLIAVSDAPGFTSTPDMSRLLQKVRVDFNGTSLKSSGLAACFRKAEQVQARMNYLAAVEVLVDLTYLIGEALVQFHRISDGLGDYGMIRVAAWLHPFLEALMEKVHRLKSHLESIDRAVDQHLIVARARGYKVEKPAPTERMNKRARGTIERAVINNTSHAQLLLQAMEELRQRSSPDRLPQVMEGIGDACMQLDQVLSSQQFRACVGDHFPTLPRLADVAMGTQHTQCQQLGDLQDAESDGDDDLTPRILVPAKGSAGSARSTADSEEDDQTPRVVDVTDIQSSSMQQSNLRLAAASHGIEGDARISLCLPGICDVPSLIHTTKEQVEDRGKRQAAQDATVWPVQTNTLFLHAEVCRLSEAFCGHGFRRHDRRGLDLQGDKLAVYEKGSFIQVKTKLDLRSGDVEEYSKWGKRLSLVVRQVPPGVEGVWKSKTYVFEFDSDNMANLFHSQIDRLSASPEQ